MQCAVDRLSVLALSLLFFAAARAPEVVGALRPFPALGSVLPLCGLVGCAVLGSWLNEVWLPVRNDAATLGMRLLGLRVVSRTGHRPPPGAWLIRWVLSVVDAMFLGAVGLLVMLSSRFHQRFGDLVAGTYVVRADWRSPDDPGLPGPHRRLGAVAQPDLPLGAGEMSLDGGGRDGQAPGYLGVGQPPRDLPHHV